MHKSLLNLFSLILFLGTLSISKNCLAASFNLSSIKGFLDSNGQIDGFFEGEDLNNDNRIDESELSNWVFESSGFEFQPLARESFVFNQIVASTTLFNFNWSREQSLRNQFHRLIEFDFDLTTGTLDKLTAIAGFRSSGQRSLSVGELVGEFRVGVSYTGRAIGRISTHSCELSSSSWSTNIDRQECSQTFFNLRSIRQTNPFRVSLVRDTPTSDIEFLSGDGDLIVKTIDGQSVFPEEKATTPEPFSVFALGMVVIGLKSKIK